MSKWAWLSTSLSEKPGIFGEFNHCLTFHSRAQCKVPGSFSNLIGSPPSSRNTYQTLKSENEVYKYIDNLEKTESDVCILAFTNRTTERNGKLPLPISKGLFEHIIRVFNLPATFLTVLGTGLATYTSSIPSKSRADGKEWENAQFIIQQNRSYSAFSIALSFNISTGKTRSLVFGAETSSLSELFEYLGSMPSQPYGPMVAPTVAMELQAHWFNGTIKKCQDRVHAIETSTGMRQFNYSHEQGDGGPQDWKNMDLVAITRDLSSFLSRFAFLKLQAETGAYLVQQMAQTTESLIEKLDKDHSGFRTDDQYDVLLKLQHIRSWYYGIEARCRYLTERTAAQTQTVYSLIASRDNLTNISIAQASYNIAEESHKENEAMRTIAQLGRKDNELMIQVAKDSRTVAVATARDSAAMQVIAAVTIFFLPATFTATFFSMSFFDFLGAEGPRVSGWSWIYIVTTAILTVVIQTAWAVLSKRKREKITQGIL